ncbi:hypothetical protein [Paenibacillus sp. NPDC057967]|uniref:hypothetical protein n=1 Tax=Paenibacillus sp. NPDC057967 TaxID=3346293 RepID=UPI0036D9D2C4
MDFGIKGFADPKVPERTKKLPQSSATGHFVLDDVHSAPDESATKLYITVGV